MTQNDILNTAMRVRGVGRAYIAEQMGVSTRQQICNMMHSMTIKTNDTINVLDSLDLDIVLKDRKDGKIIPIFGEWEGPKIGKMVCGKYRNTNSCFPLGRREIEGGFQVLYKDPQDGKYFLATHTKDKHLLKAVKDDAVEGLISEWGIEEYGTSVEKA